jgi:dipeptidyl aminopeptidase/acylaminoacyl peptidase
MKFASLVGLCLLACAPVCPAAQSVVQRVEKDNRISESIPDIPPALIEQFRPYLNARIASFCGWLANGEGMIITTRFANTWQVHWVKMADGARQQLTFFDEPVESVTVNPVRNGFAFMRDVGGAEYFQIYYYDLDTRAVRLLTDGKSRNEAPLWSNRGDRIALSTTARNGTDTDVRIASLDGAAPRPLLERGGTWNPLEWSPDDTKLIVWQYFSEAEARPYLVDVTSGAATQLYDPNRKVAYGTMHFAHGGRGIYYTSDEAGEFRELRYRDLATGKTRSLTADIPWDVEDFTLSRDGNVLAYIVNQDGVSVPHLRDLGSGRDRAISGLPSGMIATPVFSADGKRLGVDVKATNSGDAYSIDVADGHVTRWTTSEVGGLDADRFIKPVLIHYPTFDKVEGKPRQISAFYYRPSGAGPFPVVIHTHGGPDDQARPWFDSETAFWVNALGIAVIMPNVRGSSGYGKTYLGLDNDFKREDAVKDIGALLDWIATRPELDAKRVGMHGGSYGGFMTLSALTHYSERLRAGIELAGQSNFVTFLENTKGYRRDLRRAEFGDERDPKTRAFLQRIAPTTNAAKITVPLFVAAGANDPRVPASEGEQIAKAVRNNGRDVWFLEFKDEGHGFEKKQNRNYFQAASALFWQTYLLPNSPRDTQ